MLCVIGIDGSDIFVAVFDVERRSAGIDVLGDEVPAVVGQRAFAAHGGDGSFHGASFLVRSWVAGGSVTLVKSNAKALLTLRIKSVLEPDICNNLHIKLRKN